VTTLFSLLEGLEKYGGDNLAMSSVSLQAPNLQSAEDAPSNWYQNSDTAHQTLLVTSVPSHTKTLSSIDHDGLDPQNLVGKKVVGWSYYDFTLAHVVLSLNDNTQLVLTHTDAPSWDEDNGDEPELRLDDALKEALESASDARPVMIEAAVIDRKISPGWNPWARTSDMGKPDEQEHQVVRLRLETMDDMGLVTSVKEVWDTDYDCPHEITWTDVIISETAGRSPRHPPY
jgi:hypothetical protein